MYSIVDLEATGGKFNEESIIEIAIYKYDGSKVIDQFISLVNPHKDITPYVEKLTGISAKMVNTAPTFSQVAKRIIEITDNSILVAHNAQFDYRLLQIEFDRLGYEYIKESICTVILSQNLLPNQESYKLGKLVKSLGIPLTQRHRASGDARATVELFKLLIEKDIDKQIISKNVVTYLGQNVRSVFNKIIEDIKNETGVFYIYNHNNEIIYIEASKTIKSRINRLFTSNKFIPKSIQNNIKNVKFCNSIKSACSSCDLVIIHTEWNDFKLLNFKKLINKKNFIVYDMRNIYSHEKMLKNRIKYFGIGK